MSEFERILTCKRNNFILKEKTEKEGEVRMYQKPEEIRVIQFVREKDRAVMKETTMKNELETFNKFVGGYIEVTGAVPDGGRKGEPLHLVIHEEGKLINLEPTIGFAMSNQIIDYTAGNAVLLRSNEEGDFDSLTDEDVAYLKGRYGTQGVLSLGDKSYHAFIFNG